MATHFAIPFLPMLGQADGFSYSDFCLSVFSVLLRLAMVAFLLIFWLGGISGLLYLIHFLFSLPMRRAERARLFLDLLEGAIHRGQPVEEMILSAARSQDRTVGVRFHLLAAYLESGMKFGDALERVPRFLPPQISTMLRAGEKLGDLKKVLPACRETLRERPAGVRSAVHYMILFVLFFSPGCIFVTMMATIFVVPRFKEVAAAMSVPLWPITTFVFGLADSGILVGVEAIISLLMFGAVLVYLGGPRFVRWFQFRSVPVVDWISWRVPWKQKRLQRTFSAMLAVLLDGGVPEAEAVRLAGDCTANEICRRRAERVAAALQSGVKLDEAVRAFDDTGEFHWRLTNATHARGGFLAALRGWHEALDAKAFQQEEATAHVITSSVVIVNGVFVALISTAMFGILLAVLNGVLVSE